jgi:hypothetical protein
MPSEVDAVAENDRNIDEQRERCKKNRQLLREAIATGHIADFVRRASVDLVDRDLILEKAPEEVIDAESIREMLTGVSRNKSTKENSSLPEVTSAGIRLYGVTIIGKLDLNDATGKGGGPLPRLEFIRCWFRDPEILMERCRIRSLCLRGCAFTDLQASEAVIEGPVDLSFSRPTGHNGKEQDRCWVVLAGAQIAGRIYAGYSRFSAPEKRKAADWILYSRHSRYALDLRATRIHGSVHLRPDLVARGGVCLTLAKVEGSLWVNGARLIADEEWAFAADYAEIQGSLYFRPYDAPDKDKTKPKAGKPYAAKMEVHATGCISLFAAKIGGSVYFEGAKLTAHEGKNRDIRWERKTVVNLSTAIINGHCLFRGWISEAAAEDENGYVTDDQVTHFVGDGDVILSAAVIGNDLNFDGAVIRSIDADNVKVSGDCELGTYYKKKVQRRQPFLALNAVNFDGARIGGNLIMDGARVGTFVTENDPTKVDTTLCVIDGCELEQRFAQETTGFSREDRGGGKQGFSNGENGVFARGVNIGGKCSMGTFKEDPKFRFECAGRISMQEAKIGNSFYMDGATVVGPEDRVTIDLAGAAIGGKASFKTWDSGPGEICAPFLLFGGEVALNLISAKVGQELIMNGAKIRGKKTAVTAENIDVGGKGLLGTYENNWVEKHQLFRFQSWGKVSLTSATIKLGLDMSGANLHGAKIDGAGRVNSATHALDLTLLRTKSVRLCAPKLCIDGSMHEVTADAAFTASGAVILKHADIDTDLDCECSSFDRQFMADFAKVGGAVVLKYVEIASGIAKMERSEKEMCEDHIQRSPGLADLSLNGIKVGGALKIGDTVEASWLQVKPPPDYRPDGKLCPFTVDLRGAHVGVLDDQAGMGWGKNLRLWLEGFRYERLPEAVNVPQLRGPHWYHPRRLLDRNWFGEPEQLSEAESSKKDYSLWKHRAVWLRLQYFNHLNPSDTREFSPDAYEQVISSMKATGSYEDAKRISSIRITNDRQNELRGAPRSVWAAFRVLFDYGFSVRRALVSFIFCLAIGALAAYIADWHKVLVFNVGTPQSRLILSKKDDPAVHVIMPPAGEVDDPEDVPCGHHIEPALYALDVFVPVIDLKQREACSIAPEHTIWRFAQAFYALLGWVMTPLLILTASGLLKRHLEK